MAQNHSSVNLLIVVSKVFEKVISNRFLDYLDQDAAFCLASGLPGELQIFWQWYLIDLLGISTSLGLLEVLHLIYLSLLTGFDMLVFLKKLKTYCIFGLIFGFDLSFLSNRRLERFWMESPTKISSKCWCSTRVYSWLYIFPTIHKWPSQWCCL